MSHSHFGVELVVAIVLRRFDCKFRGTRKSIRRTGTEAAGRRSMRTYWSSKTEIKTFTVRWGCQLGRCSFKLDHLSNIGRRTITWRCTLLVFLISYSMHSKVMYLPN
jgi:hypothetical protein